MLPALQSGPAMLAELILFMSAARRVDPAQWLGEELLQSLREAAGGEAIGRMIEDFARIGRLPDADGPWQSWLIPFWAGETVRQLRIHFRRRDEERDAESGQRFLLETELSRLGALQIDGFFRSRHLRLMLRSRTPLPQPARSGIEAAFLGRLGADGLTGEIAFDGSGRFVIVASQTEGGSGLLV